MDPRRFDEIFRSPYIARVLMAELDPAEAAETFYTIDPDGSFNSAAEAAVIAGSPEAAEAILERLRGGGGRDPLDADHDAGAVARARPREPARSGSATRQPGGRCERGPPAGVSSPLMPSNPLTDPN